MYVTLAQLEYVNSFTWEINHLHASTEIYFLPVRESYTNALPRNTKYLTMDGKVCFHKRLFADAFKPHGCIS